MDHPILLILSFTLLFVFSMLVKTYVIWKKISVWVSFVAAVTFVILLFIDQDLMVSNILFASLFLAYAVVMYRKYYATKRKD